MKKILIIFFFLASCGYQPLYIQNEELIFKKVSLIGDKRINRKIISISTIKKNEQYNLNNEIILECKFKTWDCANIYAKENLYVFGYELLPINGLD